MGDPLHDRLRDFTRFVHLLRNADPELQPKVAEVGARLAVLERAAHRMTTLQQMTAAIMQTGPQLTTPKAKELWKHAVEGAAWPQAIPNGVAFQRRACSSSNSERCRSEFSKSLVSCLRSEGATEPLGSETPGTESQF